jgi:hypothetical protein
MAKKIVLAAVLALLAAPVATAEERPAPVDKAGKEQRAAERKAGKLELKQATRHCAELKQQVGRAAFKATYPTFRACVLARVQAERANRSEAKAECLAKLDNKAKLGKRAKAKRLAACTAKTAAADSALEREAVVNAAKSCAEELAGDPDGFRAEYGTSHNLAHAFGKCVAAKAKAGAADESGDVDEHEEEDEEDVDQAEEDDDGDVVEDDVDDEDEGEGDAE